MENKKRDIWIDTLRGIAAFGVMIAHLAVTFPNVGVRGSGTGKIFVSLFLCITGFYAFDNLSEEWKIKNIIKYYIKKIKVIIPCFLVCLLLGVGLGLYDFSTVRETLCLQIGLKHFWYIPVILGIYLIIPFLRIIVSFVGKYKWELFIILIVIFELIFPWYRSVENSIEFWWYISVVLVGSLTRELVEKKQGLCGIIYDIGVLLCILVLVIIIPGVREIIFNIPSDGYLQNKMFFIALIWGGIIFGISRSLYIKKFLDRPNIFSVGAKYGYSLYLVHCLIIDKLSMIGISEWKLVVCTIILSSIVAVIMYYIIQYPIDVLYAKLKRMKK